MIDIDISKELGSFRLSFKIKLNKNRIVIFGPSGSGKSSLLKMIAGFYSPDTGFMRINEKLFFSSKTKTNLSIQSRNVGYLPQEYTLFPNMTVKENIEYGLKKRNTNPLGDIDILAKRFKIFEYLNSYPFTLSGGQQQRAALLRALIVKPDILLLDEPFSALDKPTREELRELVADVSTSFSIPVLFVTHDLEDAFVFGDEIVVIKNGSVIECGLKQTIFNKPSSVNTALLLDFGNVWRIENYKNNKVVLENGLQLECGFAAEKGDFCCIKPESVMILRNDFNNSNKTNVVDVVVDRINFRGRYINLYVKTKNGVGININIPPHLMDKMELNRGKAISISLDKSSVIFCGGV